MDFEPTEQQRMIVEQIRRFVHEEIIPLEAKLDPRARGREGPRDIGGTAQGLPIELTQAIARAKAERGSQRALANLDHLEAVGHGTSADPEPQRVALGGGLARWRHRVAQTEGQRERRIARPGALGLASTPMGPQGLECLALGSRVEGDGDRKSVV